MIQNPGRRAVLKEHDSYRGPVAHRIPRGIVAEATARTMFTLTRHPPAAELAAFVDYHWILRWDLRGKPSHEQRVLPNLAVHATFFPGASGVYGPARDVFSTTSKAACRAWVCVSGPVASARSSAAR